MTFKEHLIRLDACREAWQWVEDRTLEQAWAECYRVDWMLWLVTMSGVKRETAVLATCAVARTALVHVPAGELRPLRCIEVTEAWARGDATLDDVITARRGAYAYVVSCAVSYAADAAAAAAAAAAAEASAYLTCAHTNNSAAASASYAANASADAVAATCAKDASLQRLADIVRSMIPVELIQNALDTQVAQ